MARLKFTGLEEGKLYVEKKDLYREVKFKVENGVFMAIYPNGAEEFVDFRDWSIQSILETEFEEVKPKIKLTEVQRKILEGRLLEGFKWIAEDESGKLFVYDDKPTKGDTWWCGRKECNQIYTKLYSLSWEDENPTHILELLENDI